MNIKNTLLKIENETLEELLTQVGLIGKYNLFLNNQDLFKKYYLHMPDLKETNLVLNTLCNCYYYIYLGEDSVDDFRTFLILDKLTNKPWTVLSITDFKEQFGCLYILNNKCIYLFDKDVKLYKFIYLTGNHNAYSPEMIFTPVPNQSLNSKLQVFSKYETENYI